MSAPGPRWRTVNGTMGHRLDNYERALREANKVFIRKEVREPLLTSEARAAILVLITVTILATILTL